MAKRVRYKRRKLTGQRLRDHVSCSLRVNFSASDNNSCAGVTEICRADGLTASVSVCVMVLRQKQTISRLKVYADYCIIPVRSPPRWTKWSRGVRTRGLRVGAVGGPRPLLFYC